jgi:hypothetical protein
MASKCSAYIHPSIQHPKPPYTPPPTHTQTHTKEFFPNVRDRLKIKININPNFTAMVTGHGRTRAHHHRFRLIDNAMCPCKEEDQTVDHLIYQCILLHTNRELFRVNIQQSGNWPASKQELITKHLSLSSPLQNP